MKCSDVSIQTKILGSNGISLILLALLAGFVWYSLSILDQEADNAAAVAKLQSDLITRENEHLKWTRQVADFVTDTASKSLDVQTDSNRCAFGTWYHGLGREEVEHKFPDIKDALNKLEAPHQRLHASAKQIAALKEAGNLEASSQLFNTETKESLKIISELFTTIRTRLEIHQLETANSFDQQLKFSHNALIGASGTAIVLGLFISVVLAKSITRPVKELVCFSSEIANGNTQAEINIDCKNEIGELAKSLQATVKHINDQLAYSQGILNGLTVPCSVFSNDDTTVFTNKIMLDLIECEGKPSDYYGQKSGLYIWGDASRETVSTIALREKRLISADREVTTRKGNTIHARITSAPFYNADGEILGTLSVWMDMTEIVKKNMLVQAQNDAILTVAGQLKDVVGIVSSASEELSAQIEQSSQGAQVQAQRMAETATAMEEMTATVIEVARNASETAETTDIARKKAQQGAQVVDTVVRGIQAVQAQALGLKEEMSSLGSQADGIGRIINVISDIADQTNLLALNAAIEAARAGDAGRGFAVVADEVRKLAEKTMAATQEVDTAIRSIQLGTQKNVEHVDKAVESIEDATRLANDSGSALNEIVRLVDVASDQVRAIATAAEEQSSTSEEINRSVDDVNRVATETAEAMEQSSRAVMDLARQAHVLSKLAQEMCAES